MWAEKYERCVDCGTTERKHFGGGRCSRCYQRYRYRLNPEKFRAIKKASYCSDPEFWKKKSSDYYNTHKEQAAKQGKQRRDETDFGGHGEDVMKRDGYRCQLCGSTEDLLIHHKDGRGRTVSVKERNNAIRNLVVVCRSCHIKIHGPTKPGQSDWGIGLDKEI